MTLPPTHRYLVEHASTFYDMKEEMDEIEPRLATALRESITHVSSMRGLKCVPGRSWHDDVEGHEDGEGQEADDALDELDLPSVDLEVYDQRLVLPTGSRVGLRFRCSVSDLLTRHDERAAEVCMIPLSEHLDDLARAKSIWSDAGLEAVFERHHERGWVTYTNNRRVHTYWGAHVEGSLSLDPKDLAREWDGGKIELALGNVDSLLQTYQQFANIWVQNVVPILDARPTRRAG